MGCQQFDKENYVYEVGSDDDTGWLPESYLNILVKIVMRNIWYCCKSVLLVTARLKD